MLVVLDSTVLIDYLRGRPVVDRVAHLRTIGDVPGTTAVNVEEVVRGMLPSEVDGVRALFDGLEVLPIDGRSGWLAGSWRREYAARGITLAQADCLIGAAAHLHGARLSTGNPKHFPMRELTVEHWPVGE